MAKKSETKKTASSDARTKTTTKKGAKPSLSELLRVTPGSKVDLASFDTGAVTGYPGKSKAAAAQLTTGLAGSLSDLQERLYADGRSDPKNARNVLVVLQGLDTSGKGGVIRHVFGMIDPQGIALHAFKAPTALERRHDFMWRVNRALPGAGMVGIFDRSQYEDVLVVRVENLVPKAEWSKRYDIINEWEAGIAAKGTTILKCFLHISPEEQKARLAARLEGPDKFWKYNPGDVDVRAKWKAYTAAYEEALSRCSTDVAPWHVIPSDRKWYRNWAVATLLNDTLTGMDLQWPAPTFDVEKEKARVAAS